MKNAIILSALLFAGLHMTAKTKHLSLESKSCKNNISYQVSKADRGVEINIRNLGQDSIILNIPVGLIFHTAMNDMQPQVVTRHQELCIAPREVRITRLNTRCGNASLGCVPHGYTEFREPVMGDSELVNALKSIEQAGLDNRGEIQNVVWHFTNKHPIGSIAQAMNTTNEEYQAIFTAATENRSRIYVDPGYRIRYVEPEGTDNSLFTGIARSIEGTMELNLEKSCDVQFAFADNSGNVLQHLKFYTDQSEGEHEYRFDAKLDEFTQGTYQLLALDAEGKTLKRLEIEI
jgi:hypothetical protein